MLTHILVKDLAIVSALELDFEAGMTALTGETGAGKSILIDALGWCWGTRPMPNWCALAANGRRSWPGST